MSKLYGVEWNKSDTEGLASADEAFVPVDDRRCVEFLEEETYGEGRRFEDRLLLWSEAVLLAVVPALADDAMEAHEFGVHRNVDEADRVEEFRTQRDELVESVLAAVITIRVIAISQSVSLGSGTV